MDTCLPFFPESFPDELFLSRISRYHLLTGNRTDIATHKELFGKREILDFVVPVQALSALITKLPGKPAESLQRLVQENTLLPVFSPFLGTEATPAVQSLNLGPQYSELGRLPQRVVGMHGEARLCVECLREDICAHGTGYWHRSHQIPGVQACWIHKKPLLQGCPVCRRPFARPFHLLGVPWRDCHCGWQAAKHPETEHAAPLDVRYAEFAALLLQANMTPIKPAQLIRAYRKKIFDHGFARKTVVSWQALREALEEEFGAVYLATVDPAYSAGQLRFWLRLSLMEGQIELPITRHLILSLYLFGNFEGFRACVLAQPTDPLEPLRAKNKPIVVEESNPKLSSMRNKVRLLQAQWPALTLDDLWKKSYASAEWLYEHDNTWLRQTLCLPKEPVSQSDRDGYEEQDAKFTKAIDAGIDALFAVIGKPARVTKERIRELLPKSQPITAAMRERYPRSTERIDSHKESYWHFTVRRMLYGASEARRLQATPINTAIRTLGGVNTVAFNALLTHFNWDTDQMVLPSFDANAELSRAGVNRQWKGPDGLSKSLAGRRHKKASKAQ